MKTVEIQEALRLLTELDNLVKATRLCLQGPRPSFPVYTGDIQRIGVGLMALAVRHDTKRAIELGRAGL